MRVLNIKYKKLLLFFLIFLTAIGAFVVIKNIFYAPKKQQSIVFLQGHNELEEREIDPLLDALSPFFQIDMGILTGRIGELDAYRVVVIADPMKKFSERDKYVLDQYLMNGGRILWVVNGTYISNTELMMTGETTSMALDLNLNDLLFNYGVRINADLLSDTFCDSIEVEIEEDKCLAKYRLPWQYAPHLYADNLIQPLVSEFVSSVDFVGKSEEIKRSVILHTSGHGQSISLPATVSLPLPQSILPNYTRQYSVAVLLKGIFHSHYTHRLLPDGVESMSAKRMKSEPTMIALIASGSVVRKTESDENVRFLVDIIRLLSGDVDK